MILGSLCGAGAQEIKPEELYQRVLPSVMTLQVENQSGEHFVGTAFLALADGIAVTSWHVIADARAVSARFADNQFVGVEGVVDKDEKSDLALVRLGAGRPQVELSLSNAPIGSRVYVIGAPKGFEFSIADGLISQRRIVDGVGQYQVSCPISGGNSGGPLLNSQGQVIGIASWSKTDGQNLNFATAASCLATLDPTRPAKPWTELHKSPPYAAKGSGDRIKTSGQSDVAEGDSAWAQFTQALKNARGEKVTVNLVKDGQEKTFTFEVPEEPQPGEAGKPKSGGRKPKVRAGLANPTQGTAKGGKTDAGKSRSSARTNW